ncbi:hypothetical protein [Candidatus Tisiphia endosymbiont of Hybos culiciformis]|uniref:hypothetical protein n=1 Tax=Candidatus Tisiphia endosymbiont of Hybos culiciformis TaxID=3139331 RepID=UPI003CCAB826
MFLFIRHREKIKKAEADAQAQANAQPTVRTNNCWGNMDYSPLAPTDTLNVKVSPALIGVLTGGAISAATQGPTAALKGLGLAIPSVMASDLARGDHSLSVSITGHDGDTYGHFNFPH